MIASMLCDWMPAVLAMADGAGAAAASASEAEVEPGQHIVHQIAMLVLGLSMVLSTIRLVRGPTLADRVIALDLLAFFAAGVVAIAAMEADRGELLMVAIVVALLTFMGTAAFAMYLERKGREHVV